MGGHVKDVDHGWKALLQSVKDMRGGVAAKVGVLADSSRGGNAREGGLTNAQLASIMEFQRPFIRPTFDKQRERLFEMSKPLIGKVFFNAYPYQKALGVLGATLAAEIKKAVTASPLPGIGPPNSPSYAAAKLVRGKGAKKKYGLEKAASPWLGEKNVAYDKKTGKTIDATKLVRTLVYTGEMINAVTWAIENKTG